MAASAGRSESKRVTTRTASRLDSVGPGSVVCVSPSTGSSAGGASLPDTPGVSKTLRIKICFPVEPNPDFSEPSELRFVFPWTKILRFSNVRRVFESASVSGPASESSSLSHNLGWQSSPDSSISKDGRPSMSSEPQMAVERESLLAGVPPGRELAGESRPSGLPPNEGPVELQ